MGKSLKIRLEGASRGGRLRRLSDWAARRLDAVPGTTPNQITALGLVLAINAIFLFYAGGIVLGAIMCALSYLTDFLDGALARYQDEHMTPEEREIERGKHWMKRRGKTEEEAIFSGAAFDPFVDKVRYFGCMLTLGISRLWWPLIALGGVFALALTIGRPIATRLKLSKGRANWLGKRKVHVEAVLIAWLVFVPPAVLRSGDDILLLVASLGGGASFISQAWSVWKTHKDARAA
ncbi:MAG: CDP-alcohol phosphatidyltransferase family protein [Patescibacteria group bacterium]